MPEVIEQTDRSHYEGDLERVQQTAAPEWLKSVRDEAAAQFAEQPFPHYKEENWRYTDIRPVVRTPFRSAVGGPLSDVSRDAVSGALYGEGWAELVIVDGFYNAELSTIPNLPGGVVAGGLAAALAQDEATVQRALSRQLERDSAFLSLNAAFLQDCAYLHVPKGAVLETPVHFVFVSTGAESAATNPRLLVVLDESAEATIVETHVAVGGAGYFANVVAEMVVGDNAKLTRHKMVEEADDAYHLSTAQLTLGRDASVKSFVITLSGQIVRNELRVNMTGENGNCDLNGLYLNDRDRTIDNALFVTHSAPRCYSRMGYKGILDGKSKSVFTGKVDVPPLSQRTDSDQLNNNLLLSDEATIDTKPQLEIFADDVKCTHGATIGGFPREVLFYFRSRGMSEEMAHGILTYGFAAEVVNEIALQPLRDRLDQYVFDKYSP